MRHDPRISAYAFRFHQGASLSWLSNASRTSVLATRHSLVLTVGDHAKHFSEACGAAPMQGDSSAVSAGVSHHLRLGDSVRCGIPPLRLIENEPAAVASGETISIPSYGQPDQQIGTAAKPPPVQTTSPPESGQQRLRGMLRTFFIPRFRWEMCQDSSWTARVACLRMLRRRRGMKQSLPYRVACAD